MDKPNIFKVIIADDDLDDHYIIKQAFDDVCPSFSCLSVFNGIELLEKMNAQQNESFNPDLVLMDLNMPLLNGLGALAQIRQNEALKKIPVYMLSTSRFDYDKTKALELGADDFFTKPNKYSELRDIIRTIYSRVALPNRL